MNLKHRQFLTAAGLALLTVSCVDDNYSLSDIDTTTRITVDDLTIPVNIDEVTLSNIIQTKDGNIRIVTIDGQEFYAFTETGSFGSNEILVKKFSAKAPTLDSTTRTLQQVRDEMQTTASADSYVYEIVDMGNDFVYNAGDIDEAIVQADYVDVDNLVFSVHLTTEDVAESTEYQIFNNLVIELPKGMTATTSTGDYDPATGLWTIDNFVVNGTEADASVTATRLDLSSNGAAVTPEHTLRFDGSFYVRSGRLTIEPKKVNGVAMPLPPTVRFSADYKVDDLVADSFTGIIQYNMTGFNIEPVSLSDIPTFLDGEGTVLKLANPQIYLSFDNPVAPYSLEYSAGMVFTAYQRNNTSRDFIPEAPVTVGYNHGAEGPYNFVMSPDSKNLTVPDGYSANLSHIGFSSLSDILAPPADDPEGGVPSRIGISVVQPQLPRQNVRDFALGTSVHGVTGRYEFMAPLALDDQSVIIYTTTSDGWNDEDVDALTITHLSASLNVTNNLQFDGQLTAYPLDTEGNRLPGVEIKSSAIPANCTDYPVTIEMTGDITHLDGVEFIARLNSVGSTPLTPSESITLHDIRVKVSGYYDKKL